MKIRLAVIALTCLFFAAKTFAQAPKARINHVAIYVMDVKKSGDFYINVLGLDTIPEPFHDGKHIWLKIGPGASMHIIQGAEAKKEYYKNNHTCFSVTSVPAFTDILRKNNIEWEDISGKKGSITTRVDGVKQIWLQDPDGYWIEVNDAKE
ncbi:MAG: VOC family protein [Chitinophagaceae bacterium]|nr:VOC family protein [Chitinophagaceae bacterium]